MFKRSWNKKFGKSEIYKKVLELKGSISAEHGIGIGKAEYITEMLDSSVLDYMKMIIFMYQKLKEVLQI